MAGNERGIKRVWNVTHQQQGAGHKQGFVLEPGHWSDFDPFLLMAEDWFQRGTFGFHPHRGIETVTYVIDGELEHKDNKGGSGLLKAGDVQWMTAGSGILHAEEPVEGSTVHSLQLWVNLPKASKMAAPRYQDLTQNDLPVIEEEGATVRLFSGSYRDVQSKTENYAPVTMIEMTLERGATLSPTIPASYNGFLYVLEGEGAFGKDRVKGEKQQVLWLGKGENEGGDSSIRIESEERLRVLLYAGEPIGEPVVARGPFVMNSEEEIRQAYEDFYNGKFN
ncbi:pirin family protein [Halalkalibacterium ligniniphilum]|uniref:pirin family protein n=1 Tax=Halalkalibacterium ligniniphilum TaxID=1134413 RepID=UPI00036BA3B5|nr:pirin family protein [Halalkalibacterium ligniniphilum]